MEHEQMTYWEALRYLARKYNIQIQEHELTEDEKALLDAKLQKLADHITGHPLVTVTFFQPDKKKTGGAYVTTTGQLKKIDDFEGVLILLGGERIVIDEILEIH